LGFWHPGKMLIECIWRKYLDMFIAPAFHFIFPEGSILRKPRLSHGIEFLMTLYLSFHQSNCIIPNLDPNNKYLTLVKNIKLLFDYFIPLALDYFTLIKRNAWENLMFCYKHLIQCFVILECPSYAKSCLLFFSQLAYWRKHHPNLYNLISRNSSMFNEEVGEISLSKLAR
jgi:hypothetical protein